MPEGQQEISQTGLHVGQMIQRTKGRNPILVVEVIVAGFEKIRQMESHFHSDVTQIGSDVDANKWITDAAGERRQLGKALHDLLFGGDKTEAANDGGFAQNTRNQFSDGSDLVEPVSGHLLWKGSSGETSVKKRGVFEKESARKRVIKSV